MKRLFAACVSAGFIAFGIPDARAQETGATGQQATPALDTTGNAESTQLLAQEEAKKEDRAKKTDAERMADLKSGQLISYGITAGAAVAIQTPSWKVDADQRNFAMVAMPYIFVLPAYWLAPQATREYCGASWAAGGEAEASAAAMHVAKARAAMRFQNLEVRIGRDYESKRWDGKVLIDGRPSYVPRVRDYLKRREQELSRATDATTKKVVQARLDEERAALIEELASNDWDPGLDGNCKRKAFGAWVGRPLNYTTSVEFEEIVSEEQMVVERRREIHPVFAVGLGYSPNAYISLLFGITVARVEIDTDMNNSNDILLAGTVAIGGNLDILGGVFK